jgi:rhamnulokinase
VSPAGGAVAAVDLGASSGRVIVAQVGPDRLQLDEVHRFPNDPVELPDGLHWDALRLFHEVVEGLRRAARRSTRLASVGIDAWGVDFGLLDETGALVGDPYHHRDPRHERGVERVHAIVPPAELYQRTGLQVLPFNTLYQLAARTDTPAFATARTMLLMPDLMGFWLTGAVATERTNASTTGLLDPRTREWSWDLIERIGLPAGLFGELRGPGDALGPIRPSVARSTGVAPGTTVTHVGSHDTASAVVGVPAEGDRFAYISCGTWSLIGVELDQPILTDASRAANFTNEGGVDGRVRFLHNIMGLWLLQESLRTWERAGTPEDLGRLLAAAAALPPGGPVIDPDDTSFMAPGDMPARIEDACRRASQPIPSSRPALARCVLDSLAAAYARTIADATRLSGRTVDTVHLVGGGARNELLCQLTADACGLPVVAGPAEATALGNILVQARSQGLVSGDLEALRALVRATHPLRRYEPGRRPAPGADPAMTR